MSIYYQDDHVTLHHGDSLEILPTLDVTADVLLTDPPYFKVKEDEWDNQWDKAADFLAWLGTFLDTTKPLLAPHASVWVFASPAMTSSVERLVGERFRVLNSIRWVKKTGNHQKMALSSMRCFIPAWEGIVFAEQHPKAGVYPDRDQELHRELFAPVGEVIQQARESAGLSRADLAAALRGYKTLESAAANVVNWELGKNLISEGDYRTIRATIGCPLVSYERLREMWGQCQAAYETRRRPFTVTDRALSSDVWSYPSVAAYPGKHPCEKPGAMLRHMIEASSRLGGLILDPFAGSGSTLEAARDTGRRAIGIEQDERYCEAIATRLAQGTFDFASLTEGIA